jgi:tetratricopeptide (TPR) repeat protein
MRHLISLGFQCDVAFQIRMHGEENVSHFFDWLATPVSGLIKIIKADFDVFCPDDLSLDVAHTPHHVVDRVTGVHFYHQFPLHDGNVPPCFLLFYEPFIQKFRYLAQRFRDYVTSKPVTLISRGLERDDANELERVFFERYPTADASFLYLIDRGEEFTTLHGHARRFDGSGSLGDPFAWWAMLQAEGLIDAPFRHSTVEILHHTPDDYNLDLANRLTEVQLQAAVALNPKHARFPLELARFYRLHQKWDRAEEMAAMALARAPTSLEGAFEHALIRWKSKKVSAGETADIFVDLCKSGRREATWLREASAALLEANKGEEALVYSRASIMASPLDREAHFNRALCLLTQGDYQEAEFAITTAISLSTEAPYYYHLQSRILAAAGRNEDAVVAARDAVKLDGGIFYLDRVAELLVNLGRSSEAIAVYRDALSAPGADIVLLHERITGLTETPQPEPSPEPQIEPPGMTVLEVLSAKDLPVEVPEHTPVVPTREAYIDDAPRPVAAKEDVEEPLLLVNGDQLRGALNGASPGLKME